MVFWKKSSTDTAEQQNERKNDEQSKVETTKIQVLNVTVHEAQDLLARDSNGSSDPYFQLRLSKSGRIFKSRTISRTLAPKWDEKYTMKTKNLTKGLIDDVARIELFDYDRLNPDDYMGFVEIPLQHLKIGDSETKWFDVEQPGDAKKPVGRMNITLERQEIVRKEGVVSRALRKKTFAALMFALSKVSDWSVDDRKLETEISVEAQLAILKVVAVATLDSAFVEKKKLQVEEAMRDANNFPFNEDEEENKVTTKQGVPRRPSALQKALQRGLQKLKIPLEKAMEQNMSEGVSSAFGVAIVIDVLEMELQIMVKLKLMTPLASRSM